MKLLLSLSTLLLSITSHAEGLQFACFSQASPEEMIRIVVQMADETAGTLTFAVPYKNIYQEVSGTATVVTNGARKLTDNYTLTSVSGGALKLEVDRSSVDDRRPEDGVAYFVAKFSGAIQGVTFPGNGIVSCHTF